MDKYLKNRMGLGRKIRIVYSSSRFLCRMYRRM
nr:MAG TPA: hypothetical protein [Caudoviricetes sp.]